MTLRPDLTEPCWEIVDVVTGKPPAAESGDSWPHYRTRAEAAEDIAQDVATQYRWQQRTGEIEALLLRAQLSFDAPCLALYCDGPDCEAANEPCDFNDEGWTHLDPADPVPFGIPDDWAEIDGKHYCDDCTPPWCDDCDERHFPDGRHVYQPPRPEPIPVHPDQEVLPI